MKCGGGVSVRRGVVERVRGGPVVRVRGLYCVQTMVDCEVWESGRCEERSG